MRCRICPRECGADRESGEIGFCSVPDGMFIGKIMLHFGEEPCISGRGGAGTVFFSGCNLRCVYCQNRAISGGIYGREMSDGELECEMRSLAGMGAECIELVTPTHYTHRIVPILESIKPDLNIPVVWNSGGYERVETLRMLDGLVDVYLPDFKYYSGEISERYSAAPDYREVAMNAVCEMVRQVGAPKLSECGIIEKGVVVRHLVLPSHREDSIAVLELLAECVGAENILLSLMSQYTPDFYIESERECGEREGCRALRRKVTSFEYDSVVKVAQRLGFEGYFQSRSSADRSYTPDF